MTRKEALDELAKALDIEPERLAHLLWHLMGRPDVWQFPEGIKLPVADAMVHLEEKINETT
jgi:hypothetical protein